MKAKRSAAWSPLSEGARALFDAEPGSWDYVSLWDGAAAQRCAFGVGRAPPDLLTCLEPEPLRLPDPDQRDFGF